MTKEQFKLSDIFDIEIVLKDGKFWYELEFDDYILDGFSDFPIKAVLKKGKRVNKKQVVRSR